MRKLKSPSLWCARPERKLKSLGRSPYEYTCNEVILFSEGRNMRENTVTIFLM
jgi:hypothetical protein